MPRRPINPQPSASPLPSAGRCASSTHSSPPRPLVAGLVALSFALVLALFTSACRRSPAPPEVVLYCAQDQTYALPILERFTRDTGIRVRPLFDSEAVKTVGLANRLLAEQAHPQCDVFWGNEELRTRQLAARQVFRETHGWAAFGYRSRRLVINTNLLPLDRAPRQLADLTNAVWRGKVALAYPLFGTTATHFLALRQHWTAPTWDTWCRALQANQPLVVEGNSIVAQLVARGEAWIGLTDSDDLAVEQQRAAPIVALPLDSESLLIPNTVAIIRQGPHPDAAQRLFDYLLLPETATRLVEARALEGNTPPAFPTLRPDWPRLLDELEPATAALRSLFLR